MKYMRMSVSVFRCIPRHRVCLSNLSDCPQYKCVGRPAACDRNSLEPVCDADGLTHPSLCHLQQAGKTLAYTGQCQVGNTGECRQPGSETAFFILTMTNY